MSFLNNFEKKFYKNKKILVAGGTGLVGSQVLSILKEIDCKIISVSLDKGNIKNKKIRYLKSDLRYLHNCEKITKGIDIVINLAGVAGSPQISKKKPRSIFIPNILFSLNLLEASKRNDVNTYLFASSYGVYNSKEEMKEENMWTKPLSPNDIFGGWAKRTGELHVEAMLKEKDKMNIKIVRPSNIYGPFGNFDPKNSMVVHALISKILKSKKKVKLFGDGSEKRDFVFSRDVAASILTLLPKKTDHHVFNIGSGKPYSIKYLAEKILKISNRKVKLNFQKKLYSGDKKRIMNVQRLNANGIKCETSLHEGLLETISWYKKNKKHFKKRYNSFDEK
jgi:GDP-L-fucose synthase